MTKRYRSGFEKDITNLLKKKKIPFQYEPFRLDYTIERTYTPDLYCSNHLIIELKGRFTSADRTKMLRVRDQNLGYTFKLWFMQDNWLTKKKLKRYSDWATENDFDYHVGLTVPKGWF